MTSIQGFVVPFVAYGQLERSSLNEKERAHTGRMDGLSPVAVTDRSPLTVKCHNKWFEFIPPSFIIVMVIDGAIEYPMAPSLNQSPSCHLNPEG